MGRCWRCIAATLRRPMRGAARPLKDCARFGPKGAGQVLRRSLYSSGESLAVA
ncbi:MAG: hypothetical protein QOG46_1814 [Pseudonocardiales bacterium]|jgi:hypothetical protein|nr:hypothetical protein [Pseudonocardiales bacterium]